MKIDKIEILGINERVNNIRGALNIIEKATRDEFNGILKLCPNKTFKFTQLLRLVGKQYTHNSCTDIPIKKVTCNGDCIILIDINGKQHFPFELDLTIYEIVEAMTSELTELIQFPPKKS